MSSPSNEDRVVLLAANLRAQYTALSLLFGVLNVRKIGWVKYANSADEILAIATSSLEHVSASLKTLHELVDQELQREQSK